MNRGFWKIVLPVFAVIALAVYCKMLIGKVPFPHELILRFLPWAGLNHAITNRSYANIGDLVTQMYPFRAFAARTVRSGNLPLWNPYLLSGAPFLGNSQSAVFYPPNALMFVFTLPVAWGLTLMIRTFLAGIFMALFIRSLGGSITGAIIGGILFALCGFVTAWQGYPMGDAAIWLPLIFYGVTKLRRTSTRTAVLITSIGFAMPVIAGHPETAVHMTLAGVLFALALLVMPEISAISRTEFLLRFALAGCLALGIAAIQMLPSVEWLMQIEFMSVIRWPPLDIGQALGFVSRDILRGVNSAGINIPESASYIAMIAFVAGPLAALHSAKRYAGILFFLSVAAFMVAFGLNPAHWLAMHTPLLQFIKIGRLVLVVDFCLAGLAGLGISVVEEGEFGDRRKLAALVLTTAGFLVAFALVYALQRHTGFRVEFLRRPSFSRALLIVGFGLVILRILNYMPRRAFAVTICAVAAFDAVTFAYGYMGFAPPQDIFPPAPVFEFLQRSMPAGRFRVADVSGVYPPNSNLMYTTPSVDGYDLPLRRLRLFTTGMRAEHQTGVFLNEQALAENDRRLDLLNVKYIVVRKFDPAYRSIESQRRFSAVLQAGDFSVFENNTVLPRAFVVPASGIETLRDPEAKLERLSEPQFDPQISVLLEEVPPGLHRGNSSQSKGNVELIREDVNTSMFRSQTSGPAVLVVSQTYYPGWKALIDGKPTTTFPADVALTGMVVPSGMHEVQLIYQPWTFSLGATITIVSLLCLVAIVLFRNGAYRCKWIDLAIVACGTVVFLTSAALVSISADDPDRSPVRANARRSVVPIDINSGAASLSLVNREQSVSGMAEVDIGSPDTLSGVTFLSYSDGSHVSETAIPFKKLLDSGSVPFWIDGPDRTAIAIVNAGDAPLLITFFVNSSTVLRTFEIPPHSKISAFLDEPPFRIHERVGTLNWRSTRPVAMSVLRMVQNPSGSVLIADIGVASKSLLDTESLSVPFVPMRNGSRGQLIMVNPTQRTLTGLYYWYDSAGRPIESARYRVAGRDTEVVLAPSAHMSTMQTGWLNLRPDPQQPAPQASVLFEIGEKNTASLINARGVPARREANVYLPLSADRMYQLAIANPNLAPVHVQLDSEVLIPPMSSAMITVPQPGMLHIVSVLPVAIEVVRSRSQNTGDVLTIYPAVVRGGTHVPHFVTGGPFQTSFVLYAYRSPTAALMRFYGTDGTPLLVETSEQEQ